MIYGRLQQKIRGLQEDMGKISRENMLELTRRMTLKRNCFDRIAKAVPFSETNVQLKEYAFGETDRKPGSIWQLLMALNECGLKNDAMLDVFYEAFGDRYRAGGSYAVYFFHGSYDVPLKANDKESLWESEEVYQFLVCAVCPVNGDYESGTPECGFLFPVFKDRSSDAERINVFAADGGFGRAGGIAEVLFL